MEIQTLALAALGGVLPDAIRTLKWARTPVGKRGKNPLTDSATYVAMVIQVGLGMIAVVLLKVSSDIDAVAMGYAAPDLITRALGSAAKLGRVTLSVGVEANPTMQTRLLSRWRE
jgi:hypothetical protein